MDKIKSDISLIENELLSFEKNLIDIIEGGDDFLKEDVKKFLFNSPKRLRVIFTFLFSKILKTDNKIVQKIALAQELIHSASLIHDDIIDESKTRRKLPSLFCTYGSKMAVLEGDLLLSYALFELGGTTPQILKIFADKIKLTLFGELSQNKNLNHIISEEQYIEKSYNKTGNLFMAGLEALFTLGEFNLDLKNNLRNFLKNYTIAFQIDNDLKISNDIKNGNYTLAVLYFLRDYPEKKPSDFSDDEKYISLARNKKEEYIKSSLKYLDKIESPYKKDLKKNVLSSLGSKI